MRVSIMKPPYEITSSILKLITSISEKIGEVNANLLNKPFPKLRKQNRIKTIHSSLRIEGNTLKEEQLTALLENKRVIGPKKDVVEVLNAIKIYENLDIYKPSNEKSFLKAHKPIGFYTNQYKGKIAYAPLGGVFSDYQNKGLSHSIIHFPLIDALNNNYKVLKTQISGNNVPVFNIYSSVFGFEITENYIVLKKFV